MSQWTIHLQTHLNEIRFPPEQLVIRAQHNKFQEFSNLEESTDVSNGRQFEPPNRMSLHCLTTKEFAVSKDVIREPPDHNTYA